MDRVNMKQALVSKGLVALFLVTLGFIMLTGTGAFAQEPSLKGACAGDVQKFCQGVALGEGRIAKCLAQHKDELSPGCTARVAQAKQQLKGIAQACEDDIYAFCEGVQPGKGRVAKCLKANEANLSPQCKTSIAKAKKEMKK